MNFLFAFASEKTQTAQSFLAFLPILPLAILIGFLLVGGVVFYFLYVVPRKKEKPNLPPALLNVPPPPSTPTSPLTARPTTGVNPPVAGSFAASPPSPPPPTLGPSIIPPSKPVKILFYQKSIFLIIVFIFLLTAIPTVIYFGVKRQQALRGKAEGLCDMDCGAIEVERECYVHAGSGCDWMPPPPPQPSWEGYCYCARDVQLSPTPTGATGNISCDASSDGGTVTNGTNITLNCSGTVASCQSGRRSREECQRNDSCAGHAVPINSFTLGPGQTSRTFGSIQPVCDAWQVDITITCSGGYYCHDGDNGCVWDEATCGVPTPTPTTPVGTPTPTPTTPVGTPTPTPTTPAVGQCWDVRVYDTNWIRITDFSTIRPNQVIRLAVIGRGVTFDRGRFRVNGGTWLPGENGTNQISPRSEFYIEYTIREGITSFQIQAMVHHPTLGWK